MDFSADKHRRHLNPSVITCLVLQELEETAGVVEPVVGNQGGEEGQDQGEG